MNKKDRKVQLEMAAWKAEQDRIYEENRKKPCKVNCFAQNGWMSPEGKLYECEYSSHLSLCDRLGFRSLEIENLGWVKVQTVPHGIQSFGMPFLFISKNYEVTQSQFNALDKWCAHFNYEMPIIIKVK